MPEALLFGFIFVVFTLLGMFEASGLWLIPTFLAILAATTWYLQYTKVSK